MTFSFDVFYATNDDLKAGNTQAGHHRVVVMADSCHDAVCAATQMVAATTDAQPTLALLRI